MTAKKCTKKCDARAKFFLPINPLLLFVTFPLSSPSSVLKLPMTKESEPTNVNCICKIQSSLRPCLHGGGGPQVGEVTRLST